MVKIKTTHVGSLPRSNELSSLLASKDNKEEISIKKFDEVVRNNVLEVVIPVHPDAMFKYLASGPGTGITFGRGQRTSKLKYIIRLWLVLFSLQSLN